MPRLVAFLGLPFRCLYSPLFEIENSIFVLVASKGLYADADAEQYKGEIFKKSKDNGKSQFELELPSLGKTPGGRILFVLCIIRILG